MDGYEDFWQNTTAAADSLNVESPALPRPRKTPRRLDDGGAPSHSFQSPEAMYRQQFYQVMDTATSSLDCRFSQAAFKHMCSIEDFVTRKGDCGSITEFHGDDLDEGRLTLHRDMFIDITKQRGVCIKTFRDAVDFPERRAWRAAADPAARTHQTDQTWTHCSRDLLHIREVILRPAETQNVSTRHDGTGKTQSPCGVELSQKHYKEPQSGCYSR